VGFRLLFVSEPLDLRIGQPKALEALRRAFKQIRMFGDEHGSGG
jgi:hypothetical protein